MLMTQKLESTLQTLAKVRIGMRALKLAVPQLPWDEPSDDDFVELLQKEMQDVAKARANHARNIREFTQLGRDWEQAARIGSREWTWKRHAVRVSKLWGCVHFKLVLLAHKHMAVL